MEEIVLDLPSMYADHHVLSVRNALDGIKGIKEIYASSAWRQLLVSFDPKVIDSSKIEQTLEGAGYPVGKAKETEIVTANDIKRDPHWESLGSRNTKTNIADLKMSGEHRRY